MSRGVAISPVDEKRLRRWLAYKPPFADFSIGESSITAFCYWALLCMRPLGRTMPT